MLNPMPSSNTRPPSNAFYARTQTVAPQLPGHTLPPPAKIVAAEPFAGLPALPGYFVLEEIARGGTGILVRVRDVRLDREPAINNASST